MLGIALARLKIVRRRLSKPERGLKWCPRSPSVGAARAPCFLRGSVTCCVGRKIRKNGELRGTPRIQAISADGEKLGAGSLDDMIVCWLQRLSSTEDPPPSVVAFNIGLFESNDGFSAYLAGSTRYDPGNSDWPCDEVFAPRERYCALPVRRGDMKWDQVLERAANAIRVFLASSDGAASFLSRAQAVTVGFDDGDLVRIR
jgi:hypothetical protein